MMKTIFLFLIMSFSLTSVSTAQNQSASLLAGLLNVAEWVNNFGAAIENIDNRESLKRLNRELSYLSTDINEVTNSKKRLVFQIMRSDSVDQDYTAEVEYLQESMRIFQDRFRDINEMVPAEFKVEENPLTQNIDNLIWQKLETLEKVKTALYGDEIADEEVMNELDTAIKITRQIDFQINKMKLRIEEKLER